MASGPGGTTSVAATPASLRAQWRRRTQREDVLGFYSERRELGFCSNFFISRPPFVFTLSPMLQRMVPLTPANGFASPIPCDCAEKAIMLCKAALMGDAASYRRIARSSSPQEAKRLGRTVRPFDHARWDSAVCRVATEVLWMKFSPDPTLRRALLDTGFGNLLVPCAACGASACGAHMGMGGAARRSSLMTCSNQDARKHS